VQRLDIRCDGASPEIRNAISAYLAGLRASKGTSAKNRGLIREILFPAFRPLLHLFDADWKLREHESHTESQDFGHLRINVAFTRPTVDIFEDYLRPKGFTPVNFGHLTYLLSFRQDLVHGGPLYADVDAICACLRFIHLREQYMLRQTLKRSKEYRLRREVRPFGDFCVLCDKLTQLHRAMTHRSELDIRLSLDELRLLSSRYCDDHGLKGHRHQDAAVQAEKSYEKIVSDVLTETSRDQEFRSRFFSSDQSHNEYLSKTVNARWPQRDRSAAEFAFVANIRHIARKVADQSAAGANALAIDKLVQQGLSRPDILQRLGITRTRFTQNCDLAAARLKHQGLSNQAIYKRLGISRQSWSAKQMPKGCFDFSPKRNPSLIWWPYNEASGPNIVSMDARKITWAQHMPSNYEGKNHAGKTIYRHATKTDPLDIMMF